MRYSVERTLAAPPAQVYAAWTVPRCFALWFGPRIFTAPPDRVVLDPRPGGAWQVTLVGEHGFEATLGGVYHEARAPARLVFTTDDALVTVTLTPAGDGTALCFQHDGDTQEHVRAAWLESLDRLTEHLGRRAGPAVAPPPGAATSRP
ncbi:SRPBCC domain-containing protein [Nonomuraea sp. NPDC050790]|uniref:SRPBCC domain-containing protein n=1 Tax=Nonomuraea sp. NPDC050790 TaxID=3364371 RepID=UPI003797DAA6